MIRQIVNNGELRAIILTHDHEHAGVDFVTGNDISLQLAYMDHKKETTIQAHVHKTQIRTINNTVEVLVIQEGELRVDFYNDEKEYENSVVLVSGDTIILTSGGHGFYCNKDTKMLEVKQGPYSAADDKVKFQGVDKDQVIPY